MKLSHCSSSTGGKRQFTLIELLTVIAVIMILVALLMPMLAKVRYRARLVSCLSRQRQIGMAVLMYAGSNNTRYPHRTAVNPTTSWSCPEAIHMRSRGYSDVSMLQSMFDLNDMACPVSGRSYGDFTDTSRSSIWYTYDFFFGWDLGNDHREKTMKRLGQLLPDRNGNEFHVLTIDSTVKYETAKGSTIHPNLTGVRSRWTSDLNVIFDDGSGRLLNRIWPGQPPEGIIRVPQKWDGGGLVRSGGSWATSRHKLLPLE